MDELKRKATAGVLWDLGGTLSTHGVGFFISIFLARLLDPVQFGVVGMALVFITIFQVFTDFGFASALIQSKNNTSLTYSSIFLFNVATGLVLFAVFQGVAPVIGNFYHQPVVTDLVRWLSFNFVLSSFNIVQRTILAKEIDFKKLNIRNLMAQGIGGVVGVVMAFRGYGVYALIGQNLTSAAVSTLVLWRVSSWQPRWEFSFQEVKRLSGFSTFMFFDQLISTFFERLDVLFVGKIFSARTLGFYSRAESINGLITKYSSASISKVFFPVMSSVEDDARFLGVYCKTMRMISFLAFGLSGGLFLLGHDIIIVLFGAKWLPSVAIFQILVLKAFAFPVNSIMIMAFLSKGKAKENFTVGLLRKAVRLVPFGIGLFYGLSTFLVSIVIVNILLTLLNCYYLGRILGDTFLNQFRVIFDSVPVLLVFIAGYYWLGPSMGFEIRMIAVVLFSILYIAYNWLTRNEGYFVVRRQVAGLISMVKSRMR